MRGYCNRITPRYNPLGGNSLYSAREEPLQESTNSQHVGNVTISVFIDSLSQQKLTFNHQLPMAINHFHECLMPLQEQFIA